MTCKLADEVKWKISFRTLLTRAFREPSFSQQATKGALSTKQSTLAFETRRATLCKTKRRAKASFTMMGRSPSWRSQWPRNSCCGWPGKPRMPPQPDFYASEKTVNWKCFSSFHGKKPDHESRKRQCSSSCLKSEETGIALGDLSAFDMAKHAARECNLAAGTTSVKEFIFPTNFWRDLRDTVLWLSRSSLREANLIFLSRGIKNAVLVESMMYPRKICVCVGRRSTF